MREGLESELARVDSTAGLKAVKALAHEYEQLLDVLDRKKETDPLSFAHIPALAEQTYRQGLSVLGWRDVPADNGCLGEIARSAEPVVRQAFVSGGF